MDLISRARKLSSMKVFADDERFPRPLLELLKHPSFLDVVGDVELLKAQPSIAVVGSREASDYGSLVVEDIVGRIAAAGIAIVSGLARGIDTKTHEVTLALKGKAIGVAGFGLNHLEKSDLAARVAGGGLVVSPFDAGQRPGAWTFLERNKVIAGLSNAILVVEATKDSGVFSTVNAALELGRPVFAIPGGIFSYTSQGCHELIKEGAMLATSVDDILHRL